MADTLRVVGHARGHWTAAALDRRRFLAAVGGVAGLAAAAQLPVGPAAAQPRPPAVTTRSGWASPAATPPPPGWCCGPGWSRGRSSPAAGCRAQPVPVQWQLAADALRTSSARARCGRCPSSPTRCTSTSRGLPPTASGSTGSATAGTSHRSGRTRTAPARGAPRQRLDLAFASCQDWASGYYPSYAHMADEDLDLVLHLGDYVYEGGIPADGGCARYAPPTCCATRRGRSSAGGCSTRWSSPTPTCSSHTALPLRRHLGRPRGAQRLRQPRVAVRRRHLRGSRRRLPGVVRAPAGAPAVARRARTGRGSTDGWPGATWPSSTSSTGGSTAPCRPVGGARRMPATRRTLPRQPCSGDAGALALRRLRRRPGAVEPARQQRDDGPPRPRRRPGRPAVARRLGRLPGRPQPADRGLAARRRAQPGRAHRRLALDVRQRHPAQLRPAGLTGGGDRVRRHVDLDQRRRPGLRAVLRPDDPVQPAHQVLRRRPPRLRPVQVRQRTAGGRSTGWCARSAGARRRSTRTRRSWSRTAGRAPSSSPARAERRVEHRVRRSTGHRLLTAALRPAPRSAPRPAPRPARRPRSAPARPCWDRPRRAGRARPPTAARAAPRWPRTPTTTRTRTATTTAPRRPGRRGSGRGRARAVRRSRTTSSEIRAGTSSGGSAYGSNTSMYSSAGPSSAASASRMRSRSGSGPASGSYCSRGTRSVMTPSRAPASSSWLTSSSSSGIAVPGSPLRAIARHRQQEARDLVGHALGEVLQVAVHVARVASRERGSRVTAQSSTARLPSNALPKVTSSAYSRSPPTGSPLARRVTRNPRGFSIRVRYVAVASPSRLGSVARMTSVTAPSASRCISSRTRSWSGPMPSIGEIAPPSTW